MSRPVDPRNLECIDNALAEVLRRKSPAERIQIVATANRTARLLAAAGIGHLHPDWDDTQIEAEVIRRVCSRTK